MYFTMPFDWFGSAFSQVFVGGVFSYLIILFFLGAIIMILLMFSGLLPILFWFVPFINLDKILEANGKIVNRVYVWVKSNKRQALKLFLLVGFAVWIPFVGIPIYKNIQVLKGQKPLTVRCIGDLVVDKQDNKAKINCNNRTYTLYNVEISKLETYLNKYKDTNQVLIEEIDKDNFVAHAGFEIKYYPDVFGLYEVQSFKILQNTDLQNLATTNLFNNWWINNTSEYKKVLLEYAQTSYWVLVFTGFVVGSLFALQLKNALQVSFSVFIKDLLRDISALFVIVLIMWPMISDAIAYKRQQVYLDNANLDQIIRIVDCKEFKYKEASNKNRCNGMSDAYIVYCDNAVYCIDKITKLGNMCFDYCPFIQGRPVMLKVGLTNTVVDIYVPQINNTSNNK